MKLRPKTIALVSETAHALDEPELAPEIAQKCADMEEQEAKDTVFQLVCLTASLLKKGFKDCPPDAFLISLLDHAAPEED